MAFGDILSGLADASHEHHKTLLQMDYQNKRELADKYGKIAEDQSYDADVRAEALKRALTIHTIEPGKKLPKEFEAFTFTIEPKNVPGIPAHTETPQGSGPLGIQAPAIPPGQMPAQTQPIAPMSFAETLSRAGQTARQTSQIKTETELNEIQQRGAFLRKEFPGLSEDAIAAMATGHTAPNLSFSLPGTMDASQVKQATGLDVAPGHYNVRMVNGQWLPTPVEAKTSGGLKFAQNEQGNWVGYTTDQYGKVQIQSNLGLTPPQGVPTDSILHGVKIMSTPDGGYAEVPYTQTTTRVRSGGTGMSSTGTVPAPTPPPGQPAAQFGDPAMIENIRKSVETSAAGRPVDMALSPPQPSLASYPGQITAPTPPPVDSTTTPAQIPAPVPPRTTPVPASGTGSARTISGVGKSLTPNQIQENDAKIQSFDNMINRMTGVLQNSSVIDSLWRAGKIAFSTDPAKPGRLVLTRSAGLSPEESQFAADYISLGEDINLLRGVFQATGFRGPEAFATQQAQRGPLLGDPQLFRKVLTNSMRASVDQLSAINRAQTYAGRPTPVSDGLLRAYLMLNNNDENKALAALKRDGWQVQ